MTEVHCVICRMKFEALRISKLACSPECERIRKSLYDRDRYLEFRNADRKRKREMLVERYSISSTNIYKLKYTCSECMLKFYYDYSIFEKFNNTYVSSYNTTSWGAACCPSCGAVEKTKYDEDDNKYYTPMTEVERKLYLTEIHKCKTPSVRREAIYLRNQLDFISEAETVRKIRNYISDIGKLTNDQINLCIKYLFEAMNDNIR